MAITFELPKALALKLPGLGGSGSKAAALVIRPEAVELVWSAGPKTMHHERVELTAGDDEALVAAIRQAVASAKLKSNRVAVSIASPEVLVRYFSMPMLPKGEWQSAVQFEARKYIPFKMDTLVWDYVAAPVQAAGQELLEAVFVGISRDVFDRLKAVLAAAGVQPVSIEPLSRTLARLVAGKDGATGFDCVVEVRPRGAHVVIARGGIPYLTREVHAPAAAGEADAGSPASLSQRLASEMSLSFDFFKREYHSALLSRVVLFGDEAMVGECNAQLAPLLTVPVETGHAIAGAAAGGVPMSFAAAAGLLLRGQGVSVIEFLSHSQVTVASPGAAAASPKIKPAEVLAILRTPRAIGTAGAVAAAMTFGLWVLGSAELSRQDRRLQALKESRARVAAGLETMDDAALQPIQTGLKEQIQFLKSVIEGRPRVASKLDALARSLPEGVWLTSLAFDSRPDAKGKSSGHLTIQGACFLGGSDQELKAIQEFESNVKRDMKLVQDMQAVRLGKIDAAGGARQSSSYRTFELQCQSTGKL